jgi:hypothetical protein
MSGAWIDVWFVNGGRDRYDTEGGETDALAQELDADPEVSRIEVHYACDQ